MKFLLTLTTCLLYFTCHAQTASVEKSTYGLQTGILGIWIHNEAKLTNQIALRTELGMNTGFFAGSIYPENFNYLSIPLVRAEPRWYYNLERRLSKSKAIAGNSGNFLALQTTYYPPLFVVSNIDNLKIPTYISIIPTWGIKRNVGKHFTYETGIGIGYYHQFHKGSEDTQGTILNLHLRVGYRF